MNPPLLFRLPRSERPSLPLQPLFLPSPTPKSHFPPLCFQSVAHSFALRGEGSSVRFFIASLLPYLIPFALLSPLFATLTESSILRSPQLLCLPLLRKLPGCPNSLPISELFTPHPPLSLASFDSRSSILSILFVFTFLQTLWQHRNPQLFSFQSIPNSFTETPGVGHL